MFKHVLEVGPTSKCPSSQVYSTVAPTSNPNVVDIVEFGGCSGRPHVFGSEKQVFYIKFDIRWYCKNKLTMLADEIQWCITIGITPKPSL